MSTSTPSTPVQAMPGTATGILYFLAALVMFASFDAYAKHMLQWHSPEMMNFSRYIVINGMAVVLLAQAFKGKAAWQQIRRHAGNRLLWLRSLCLGIVATCFMTALVDMPLAEATAIYFTAPLIMVALSARLLGEPVRKAQWWGVAVGFIGMLLMVRPGLNLPLIPSLMMVAAAISYALFQILTRRLSGYVPFQIQFFYMAWICLLLTFAPAAFRGAIVWPQWHEWGILILGGLVSGAGQLLLLAAYRRVAAATLAPLNYLHLLLAVLISAFWFHRIPDGLAMLGMSLIAAAGLYLGWQQRPRKKPASATQAKVQSTD